jgi:hypothetical protein
MEIKLEKLDKHYSVKTDSGKILGNFSLDVGGTYYFWGDSQLSVCWDAWGLRQIADLLDEVNKEFDDEVDEYFDLLRRNEEDQARVEYRCLMNSGMMFEFYPHLTGVWKNDKNTWFDEFKELTRLRASKTSF